MDLLIAGLPRSGTTMLASILHDPPNQVMLDEPAVPYNAPKVVHKQPKGAKRWGTKQVMKSEIEKSFERGKPASVIFITRDLEECGYSYYYRILNWFTGGRPPSVKNGDVEVVKTLFLKERYSWLDTMARYAVETKKGNGLEVDLWLRYKDFVEDPEPWKEKIRDLTGFSTDGFPNLLHSQEKRGAGRMYEVARHKGVVQNSSVGRYKDEEEIPDVTHLVEMNQDYQETFGY